MTELAVAAVTATLRTILQNAISPNTVTTLTPDKAAAAGSPPRLNLFLYHLTPNAAWRNQYIPTQVRPGERGFAPLALNLFYVVSAYGDDQGEEAGHTMLGKAMLALHDRAVLTREEISNATSIGPLQASNLAQQFEQVKLTLEPLSVEEMYKLWATFQTQYRVSAAYQASVVLIESKQPSNSPLPVLRRGSEDRGPVVTASMPGVLEGVEYRDLRSPTHAFSAAQLGDTVTLLGRQLPGRRCRVIFIDTRRQPSANDPDANVVARLIPEDGSNESRIFVKLDASLTTWVAGPLNVALEDLKPINETTSPTRKERSNFLRFGLAPSLIQSGNMQAHIGTNKGRRQLNLICNPGISQDGNGRWPNVTLVLSPPTGTDNAKSIPLDIASSDLTSTKLPFDVQDVSTGTYRVRVRVDMIESLVMQRAGETFQFDERQVVQL